MELTINSNAGEYGPTYGCIYTRESNGADPEVNYTYRFDEDHMTMTIWLGNDIVARMG